MQVKLSFYCLLLYPLFVVLLSFVGWTERVRWVDSFLSKKESTGNLGVAVLLLPGSYDMGVPDPAIMC